jgi:hypothetical protein
MLSGSTTRIASLLVGTSLGHGTATITAFTFPDLGFPGTFSLPAADMLLPAGTTNLILMLPFLFEGNIRGCDGSALICLNEVFSTTQLVDQGIATVEFSLRLMRFCAFLWLKSFCATKLTHA